MTPGDGPRVSLAALRTPGGERGFVLLLGALVAFGPMSIDLYLPALPAIARGLGCTMDVAQLTVTVFLAGFCVGMLCYGPLSDRFGRRPVLLGGIAMFVAASLACLLASSIQGLIVARLFQALGGGAASVLARAVVRDVYAPTEAIRKLSLMAMVTAVAPLLAPLVGSAVTAWGGWRASFAVLLLWGLACLAAAARHLPETLAPEMRIGHGARDALLAYRRMLGDPSAIGLVIAGGMSFAAMFAYITGGPFYFIELNGFSPTAYSLIFSLNAIAIFLANYANSRLIRRCGPLRMVGTGCAIGLAAAALLPIVDSRPHAFIVALFPVVGMTGLLGANCVGLLMQHHGRHAGAAAALFGAGQFGFGVLASGLVGVLYDGSGRPMAWVMLGTSLLSGGGFLLYRARAGGRAVGPPAPS